MLSSIKLIWYSFLIFSPLVVGRSDGERDGESDVEGDEESKRDGNSEDNDGAVEGFSDKMGVGYPVGGGVGD